MSIESEGREEKEFTPWEFVSTFEAAAETVVKLEKKTSAPMFESGYCKESESHTHLIFKRGPLPDEVLAKQAAEIENAKAGIPQFSNEASGKLMEQLLDAANKTLDNKHVICKQAAAFVEEIFGGGSLDEQQLNSFAAVKVYEAIYGQSPDFELEGFFESEVGIVFAVKSAKHVQHFYETYEGVTLKRDIDESADFACSHTIRGIPIIVAKVDVLPDTNELTLPKYVYNHEVQHNVDSTFMYSLDLGRRYGSDAEFLVPPSLEKSLKSEIFAYAPQYGSRTYGVLTDPEGPYNYSGILSGDSAMELLNQLSEEAENNNIVNRIIGHFKPELVTPEVNIEPSKKDRYMSLVRNATSSLAQLTSVYKYHFHDDEQSSRMAIGMLDSFPMQDWPTVLKMVQRHSSFPEYKEAVAEFNKRSKK